MTTGFSPREPFSRNQKRPPALKGMKLRGANAALKGPLFHEIVDAS